MSEKTGLSHILEHRWHAPLIGQWPGLVLPWTLIAVVAVFLPVGSAIKGINRNRTETAGLYLPGAAERIPFGSPGGGPWETCCYSVRGLLRSPIITFRACPAWPC